MKCFFTSLAILVLVSGCDMFDRDIKQVVRDMAKDPDSVQFREVYSYRNRACAVYNAKNGFGAYVGFETIWLRNYNVWTTVGSEDAEGKECTAQNARAVDEADVANDKANDKVTAEILKALYSKSLISKDITDVYSIPEGPCLVAAKNWMYSEQYIQRKKVPNNFKDDGDRAKAWIAAGSCTKPS